jgi:hypothetical protein
MGVSLKTNRMLWGRAASRCSLPDCRRELVLDPSSTDDPSLVGEAAHIVAEEKNGPRGESDLTPDQRNKYDNLILLCNVHHKQVDDQPAHFTVQELKRLKLAHEEWIRSSLQLDPQKQADDEKWAGYIDEWSQRAQLNNWLAYTSWLLGPTPEVNTEFFEQLSSLRTWLLSRVWPERYPNIRLALEAFRMVVGDFVNVFQEQSDQGARHAGHLRTTPFYKMNPYEPERYQRLLDQFEFHVDLIHDLVFEITRAANYVCDLVREYLDASFRIEEGVLLVERPIELKLHTLRLEYRDRERTQRPYPGLENFLRIRESRDRCVGSGVNPEA